MSTLEELDDLDRRDQDDKKRDDRKDRDGKKNKDGDEEMKEADEDDDVLDEEILSLSTQDIQTRKRLLENDSRIMKSELSRLSHEKAAMGEKIKDNMDKIANNRQLPYLVGNVVELLDLDPTAESSEEGANIDLDATRVGKSAVIKTSTRQTIFLPLIGLVDSDKLKPGDLIGVNKDSYLILDTLPAEYDSRVKAMEVDEKPTEQYGDVGGLDKQISELVEAIVWPMKEAERFKKIGIKAPKGALMYGPPVPERPFSRELAQHKRTPPSSSWQVHNWYRCLSVTVPSWFETASPSQRRRRRQSSSSTSWMPLVRSVSTVRRVVIERSSVPCWSCLTNWTVLPRTTESRSSPPPTVLMSSTLPSSVLVVWTARSSFPYQTRRHVHRFSRSTRVR
ncbi:hypothetical protein V2G26_009924 [Clonostachys chloroleuca]